MHSSPSSFKNVPPWKLARAWGRFLFELAVYGVVVIYAAMFMTHTLTQFRATYAQVFAEHKNHQTLWDDFCLKDVVRQTHPDCEKARKALLLNPYDRIVHTVVQDIPFLGMCGKHESCWYLAVELLNMLFTWSNIVKFGLFTICLYFSAQIIVPHFMFATQLTKTWKNAYTGIAPVGTPVTD